MNTEQDIKPWTPDQDKDLRMAFVNLTTNSDDFLNLDDSCAEYAEETDRDPGDVNRRVRILLDEPKYDWIALKEDIVAYYAFRLPVEKVFMKILCDNGQIVTLDENNRIEEFLSLDGSLRIGEPTPECMLTFLNQKCRLIGVNGINQHVTMERLAEEFMAVRSSRQIGLGYLVKKFEQIGPSIHTSAMLLDSEKIQLLILTGLPLENGFVNSYKDGKLVLDDQNRIVEFVPNVKCYRKTFADSQNDVPPPAKRSCSQASESLRSTPGAQTTHVSSEAILKNLLKAIQFISSPGIAEMRENLKKVKAAREKTISIERVHRTLSLCIGLMTTKVGRPVDPDVSIESMLAFLRRFSISLKLPKCAELESDFLKKRTEYQDLLDVKLPLRSLELAIDLLVNLCT